MPRYRRLFAGLFLAAVCAGALEAQTVRLAIGYIPHIQFAPLYVGIEKGFYKAEGVELSIQYGFGIDIFSLLTTGNIDLGLSDSDQLLVAGARGLPLKAVFQYYQKYPASIVALRSKYPTADALRGKVIGTPELFGTSYIGLRLFLERYTLEGSAQVQRIGYTQLASLEGGKADAVVVFTNNEPLQLRAAKVDFVEWKVSDFSDMVGASFITADATLQAKGDLLRRFARATRKAMEYTVAHRAEAVEISRKYTGAAEADNTITRAVLDATAELFVSPRGWGVLDPAVYERSLATLKRLGLVETTYPVTRVLAVLGD